MLLPHPGDKRKRLCRDNVTFYNLTVEDVLGQDAASNVWSNLPVGNFRIFANYHLDNRLAFAQADAAGLCDDDIAQIFSSI
jgi:hypothetical protein